MTPNPPPPTTEPRRSTTGVVVGGILIAAAIAVGLWYFFVRRPEPPTPVITNEPMAELPDAGTAPPLTDLPQVAVTDRDERARQELANLSNEPEWKKWLEEQKDLLGKFAAAVANIAEGESPRTVLAFLAPGGKFEVTEGEATFIADESYARYDTVARVFGSIDVGRAAKAYQTLHPLIDAVYAEISRPGSKFDDTFAKAIDRLVSVPVQKEPVEVVAAGALYAFADPELEKLSAAEKHLLRMGPKNQAIIQRQLRELKEALGLGT